MNWKYRNLYRWMRHHERHSRWLTRRAARLEEAARGPGWRTDFAAADALSREAAVEDELAAEYRKELGL